MLNVKINTLLCALQAMTRIGRRYQTPTSPAKGAGKRRRDSGQIPLAPVFERKPKNTKQRKDKRAPSSMDFLFHDDDKPDSEPEDTGGSGEDS